MGRRIFLLLTAFLLILGLVLPCLAARNYDSYEDYLKCNDIPKGMLRYEQIAVIGEFVDAEYYDTYAYFKIKDANSTLSILWKTYKAYDSYVDGEPTFFGDDLLWIDVTDIAEHEGPYVFIKDSIEYHYCAHPARGSSSLQKIVIPLENGMCLAIERYVNPSSDAVIGNMPIYPQDGESTWMTRLLQKETAKEAIAELRASIENYREPVSPWVIVAIVGGGVLLVAVVICTILLWRRKKKKAASVAASDAEAVDAGAESPSDAMEADGVSLSEDTATDTPKDSGGA